MIVTESSDSYPIMAIARPRHTRTRPVLPIASPYPTFAQDSCTHGTSRPSAAAHHASHLENRTLHGSGDARRHERDTSHSLAYTTFLTVLRNLTKRGFLEQVKGNRAHVFVPLIDERTYKLAQVRQMRQDFCGGDVAVLLGYLAQDEEIDEATRVRLRTLTTA